MERCSVSSVIRQTPQWDTALYTCPGLAKKRPGSECGHTPGEHGPLAHSWHGSGAALWATAWQQLTVVVVATWLGPPCLRPCPREQTSTSKRVSVHGRSTHSCKKVETAQVPISGWREKQDVFRDSAIKRTLANPETRWAREVAVHEGPRVARPRLLTRWQAGPPGQWSAAARGGQGRDRRWREASLGDEMWSRVAMAARLSEYAKTTLKSWILWHVNHISIKPL